MPKQLDPVNKSSNSSPVPNIPRTWIFPFFCSIFSFISAFLTYLLITTLFVEFSWYISAQGSCDCKSYFLIQKNNNNPVLGLPRTSLIPKTSMGFIGRSPLKEKKPQASNFVCQSYLY